MKLKVLGSSSSGNCYVLENSTSAIIIEAGVHPKHVKRAIDFDVAKIRFVLVSHSHKDHSKYAEAWAKSGCTIYMGSKTAEECGLSGHNIVHIDAQKPLQLGEWTVMPFELIHDVQCFGFLMSHEETGTFPFITDTHYCPYMFPGISNIMIECNYDDDLLEESIVSGKTHPIVRNRVLGAHISLSACIKFIQAHDMSKVNNIVLMHLSSSHGDPTLFKERIEAISGTRVSIAKKDLIINFNKTL
jgi:phosphoribosyl 1,2-cyclic phosphodiesterase